MPGEPECQGAVFEMLAIAERSVGAMTLRYQCANHRTEMDSPEPFAIKTLAVGGPSATQEVHGHGDAKSEGGNRVASETRVGRPSRA